MAIEVYEKWLEYYDNNGLSWLATQVQASIKQAFFAGYEAAEQNVQPTIESGRELPAEVVKVESVLPAKSG